MHPVYGSGEPVRVGDTVVGAGGVGGVAGIAPGVVVVDWRLGAPPRAEPVANLGLVAPFDRVAQAELGRGRGWWWGVVLVGAGLVWRWSK